MNLPDFFKSLKLDAWYMAIVYLGGIVLFASFFFEAKVISNAQLQMLAGGAFLFGVGEWKNHKKESHIKPSNAYTGAAALITYTVRKPDPVGLVLDFAGLGLVIVTAISIVRSAG